MFPFSGGELLSLGLNLVVGLYFWRFYPKYIQRQFRDRPLPPLFAFLHRFIPIFGIAILVVSGGYIVLRIGGLAPL